MIDSYSKRLLRRLPVSTIVGERMDCAARTPKGGETRMMTVLALRIGTGQENG